MEHFVPAAKIQDIPLNTGVVSELEGKPIAIFNVGGKFNAVGNSCPHRGGPLGEGELNGEVVTCPWHGWQFNVCTGVSPENEKLCIETYPVKIEAEDVLVELHANF